MKLKHCLIIRKYLDEWIAKNTKPLWGKKRSCIIALATSFNWDVFMAAKVEGDTISFMARELGYLTSDGITKALMQITRIDGTGICGSGVKRV